MRAEDVEAELHKDLPPVTVLSGADISMLVKLARGVFMYHQVHPADLIVSGRAAASDVRYLVEAVHTAPWGPYKAIIMVMDQACPDAQNILLRTLEDPPPLARFILVASKPLLPAVMSRARYYGVTGDACPEISDDNAKAAAEAAVRAAQTRDPAALADVLKPWADRCGCTGHPHDKGVHYQAALERWAVQASMFDRHRYAARTVLRVLSGHPRARPQNAAAAALSLAYLEDEDW